MRALKKITGIVIVLLIIAAPITVFTQRQSILDWSRLHNYVPPAEIAQLASDDTMTDEARHDFYVSHPQLVSDTAQFRNDCPQSEQTIVLGCYVSNQTGWLKLINPSIYVFKVNDSRLNGVTQVTAAHETLHAAYDRLSDKERAYVDGLLQNYYATQTDRRITDTINAYKKTEPNDVVNEMHSIFGTEIATLPSPLENYYKQYFTNRATVVAYSTQYQAEFTSRTSRIDAYDRQLATMKSSIETQEADLNSKLRQLKSDQNKLNNLRNSGDIEAYNAAVPGFNSELDEYNNGVNNLQKEIADYNNLIKVRNSVAEELRGLDQAIDTRLTPQSP